MRRNLLHLIAATVLAALTAAAQDKAPTTNPPPNKCVIPIPREGQAHERFLELNRRVQANQDAQLILVGDSITQGWESSGKDVWAKYYAPRHAINLGIGSDHTQHVLWRLENGNIDGLKPKVAVLLIGVNNVPDETNLPGQILEGVTAVVHKLRERLPQTKVLLLGIFPFREDFCASRAKAAEINQALQKLDDGQWVHWLDLSRLFVTAEGRIPRTLMPDFVHPTPAGYRLWAEAMEPKLASLLGEKPVQP